MKKSLCFLLVLMSFNVFSQTAGSSWKLQYVWNVYEMTNVTAKKSEFVIAIADKKISGKYGCNTFSGNLEYTKGDHVKPIKITNQKDNCPATPDPIEKAVFAALKLTTKLVIGPEKAKFYQGDKLVMELNR
jgi:heat shock protein HslJ